MPASAGFPGARTSAALFLVLAFLGLALHNAPASSTAARPGCIDRYWVQFWLINYEAGYTRRTLLGSVARALSDGAIDAVALNVVCIALALLLIALSAAALVRALPRLAGPLLALGHRRPRDAGRPAARRDRRRLRRAAPAVRPVDRAIALVLPLSFLVHEAAIFLLLPAL